MMLEQTKGKPGKKKSPKKTGGSSSKQSNSNQEEEAEEERKVPSSSVAHLSTTSAGHYPAQSTLFQNTHSEYSPSPAVDSVPHSELTPPRSDNEMSSSQYYGLRLPYVSPYNGYGSSCHQSNFPLTPPLSAGLGQEQSAPIGGFPSSFKELPTFESYQGSHPSPLMGVTNPYHQNHHQYPEAAHHHHNHPHHHHHHHHLGVQKTASESLAVFAASAQPFKMEPL